MYLQSEPSSKQISSEGTAGHRFVLIVPKTNTPSISFIVPSTFVVAMITARVFCQCSWVFDCAEFLILQQASQKIGMRMPQPPLKMMRQKSLRDG